MKQLLLILPLLLVLAVPARATDLTAPTVPASAAERMQRQTDSLGEGILEILRDAISGLRPDLAEGAKSCLGVTAAAMLLSLVEVLPEGRQKIVTFAGTMCVAGMLLSGSRSLVRLASDTITEMSEYGKLLLPVMTTAMASQGNFSSSAALYAGTASGNWFLTTLIAKIFVPMVYLFLALATAGSAIDEPMLKKLRDTVKGCVSHCLKTILSIFTGYMTITGVVSGTTDAATLKATKLTISGLVPVVGGILSDASESVLVGAGLVKNAAGIYGILAVIAVCLLPFLRIGVHYLLLKGTAAVCGIFAGKRLTELVEDFSGAMGLLLAMTGAECLLLLISTVCFLRGVG